MSNKKQISYSTLKVIVDKYNALFEEDPKDVKVKEKRRALFNLRRQIMGSDPIDVEDFELIGSLIVEEETNKANQIKEFGYEEIAINSITLAENTSEIILEILIDIDENEE